MAKASQSKKSAASLSDAEFQILLALADTARHGYGIMQEVATSSQGSVRLGPGTLYGAIKRMLDGGLIEESPRRPAAPDDDDRRRCYYRLTKLGRSLAEAETQRLAALVEVACAKKLITRQQLAPGGAWALGGGTA